MLQIAIFCLAGYLASLGVGYSASKVMRLAEFGETDKFWLGTIILVICFQFYSLFFPINYSLTPIFIILITIGVISFTKAIGNSFKDKISKNQLVILFVFFYLSTSLIIAASFKINWYDSDLYHLNAVRYIFEYKAIPGLIHIHSRLGFNSSFFVYSAVVESFTARGASSHLSLTIFGVVILYQWIRDILQGTKRVRYFCFITMPFLLFQFFRSSQFPSLSTDFAAALVSLQVFYLILSKSNKFLLVLALAALAVTTKLSSIYILPMALVYVIYTAKKLGYSNNKAEIVFGTLGAFLVIGGFVIRNIILSGWLVFPSPVNFLRLSLPWAASVDENSAIANDILAWARFPGERYLESLGQSLFSWLVPWLGRNQHSYELAISACGVAFFVIGFVRPRTRAFAHDVPRLILFLGILSGLVLWFVSAPDLRFASVLFWVLASVLMIPKLTQFGLLKGSIEKRLLITILFTSMYSGLFPLLKTPTINLIKIPSKNSYLLEEKYLKSDITHDTKILKPNPDDVRCGDSPVPCVPYDTNFRFIDGEFSKGVMPI